MNSGSDSCILVLLLQLWEFVYDYYDICVVCFYRYIDGLIAPWLNQNHSLCPGCVNKSKVEVILECVGLIKDKDSLAFPGSML